MESFQPTLLKPVHKGAHDVKWYLFYDLWQHLYREHLASLSNCCIFLPVETVYMTS